MKHISYLALLASVLLVGVPSLAAEFEHRKHLEHTADEGCEACHLPEAVSIVPDTAACAACHDDEFVAAAKVPGPITHGPVWSLNHRAEAAGKTYDCAACHQQADCFECHQGEFADEMGELGNDMANVHRSDFLVTHPIGAGTDPQLCSTCHTAESCRDCHERFRREDLSSASHRRGFSSLQVSPSGPAHEQFNESQCLGCHPNSVLPTHQWSGDHAREARRNLATCQACHPDGDECLKCHSARGGLMVNPHPKDWGDIQSRMRDASKNRTCRKCH